MIGKLKKKKKYDEVKKKGKIKNKDDKEERKF